MPKPRHRAKLNSNTFEQNAHLVMLRNLPEVASWRALMEGFRSVYSTLEKGLVDDGWSMSRFQIILILYFDGPLSQSELSQRLYVTRGNISTFCKRLQTDGLIGQVSDSHLKRPPFKLTRKGQKLFEHIFPKHIDRIKNRMPVLDLTFVDTLRSIANRKHLED